MRSAPDSLAGPESRRGRRKLSVAGLNLRPPRIAPGETLQDAVYRQLRDALMVGAFAANQALSARSVAEVLQVSTTPAMDALRRLSADGVLQAHPQSSFTVLAPTRSRYLDIIEARVRLESLLTARAAELGGKKFINQLSAINDQYQVGSPAALLKINYAFHFAIYDAAQMPDVRDLVMIAWMRIGALFSLIAGDLTAEDDHTAHERIINGLSSRAPEIAAQAMEHHIRATAARVADRIAD